MTRSRWGVSVLMRSGRFLMVTCDDSDNANAVVELWKNAVESFVPFIEMPSRMGTRNLTLVSEIVSMSVIDYARADEMAVEDERAIKRIKKEAEYPGTEDDEYE